MSRPRNDGRSALERARELVKLTGYDAHDRSGELSDALSDAMVLVELALKWKDHPDRYSIDLRRAIDEIEKPVKTDSLGFRK